MKKKCLVLSLPLGLFVVRVDHHSSHLDNGNELQF